MSEVTKNQFDELKAKHPGSLLLFRTGDFYETYEDDAVVVSDALGITLTKRGKTRMAGFPHHALDTYLPRLVRAGHRVAICDQLKEPPAPKPTSQTLNPTNEMERTIKEIGLDEIRPSAMNPRKTFDEEGIHELADNIRQHGLLQPITIRPVDGETPYEIVCGERRYRAFLLNQKIRVKQPSTIPCIVRDMSDEDALDAMITENLQRVDVDPMEEAFAFAQLVGMGKTVDEIALRFGKSKRFIADRIRLDKLIPELKAGVTSGGVNIGAALLLCKLDEDTQRDFLDDWEPDPDDPITKDNVNEFTDRLFMNITRAPWSEEFQGSCKCTCDKCEFNNSNAGCLFYEMKINRDDACCTNRDRFETKRMDWLKRIIDKNADVLVKAGDQLETGKTVVATINLYGREDKEFNELIEYAKGQGYECVKCSDVFNRWSSYRESDERLKEKLANNEVYRVLLIEQEYNGVSVRIAYFDFQKKASAEDKTGAEAMQLVAQYKDNISKSRSSIAKEMRNAIKEFDTKGITSEILKEPEWKAFIALLIYKSPYFVREAIMGNERDEIAFVESSNLPYLYVSIIREFMKGLVSDSSVEYYHPLQACQALLIDAWGIDATDVRAKVAEKLAKKQHKIEERLTALGYDTDGKKLDF